VDEEDLLEIMFIHPNPLIPNLINKLVTAVPKS
jgi:hypothetical protein